MLFRTPQIKIFILFLFSKIKNLNNKKVLLLRKSLKKLSGYCMKEVDDVKFYDVAYICEMIHKYLNEEEITNYFEEGKIKGKKIDNKWHADKEAIDSFLEELAKKRFFLLIHRKLT